VEWSELVGECVNELEDGYGSVLVSVAVRLVAETRGQFGKPDDGEYTALKAVTKQRLMKTAD
jgi:hypothetical protein